MKQILFYICLNMTLITVSQEQVYFNKIYNPLLTYAKGRAIVEMGGVYYCLSGTGNPSTGLQSFLLFKLNTEGEVIQQNLFSIPGHNLYPGNVGGYLLKANDGNLVYTYQAEGEGMVYCSVVKINENLDTLWKRNYTTEYQWTLSTNIAQTDDMGFIITGYVLPFDEEFYDILLIKTDSLGNEQWHKTYGTDWLEMGGKVVQTNDGGYLIGGLIYHPGIYHSMNAVVVKTDSIGNEQWTKYYGNPDVDDDWAFVALAGDGNYLVATVYGEYIFTNESRIGIFTIYKINVEGDIIWMKKFHPMRRSLFIKNFEKLEDSYLTTGWSDVDTISLFNSGGWLYKIDNNLDSLWRREYQHFYEYLDVNYLYDFSPTPDNGYIAIGQSNEAFTQSNMWVIKLDSMGCDTPGCATGTFIWELSPSGGGQGEVRVWPNPCWDEFYVTPLCPPSRGDVRGVKVFNSQGLKVEELEIPGGTETLTIHIDNWTRGIYFLVVECSGQLLGSTKIVVK